jgi:GNAT superfamily N-acetyltransferase
MTWRLPPKEFAAGKGAGNRRALRRLVGSDQPPGVLAYCGGEVIGWCAVAPRQGYIALERSRVLAPVDEQPVWSISCLFVARAWRRCGVSAQLISAAVEFAESRGARIVEGYPTEPYAENVPAAFAWTGIPAAFEKAGFVEAARRSKARPIMRRTLATKRPTARKRKRSA